MSSIIEMADPLATGLEPQAWFEACRRMVAAQRELYGRTDTISERTEYAGVGEGGDRSLVIDRQAEDIVFAELDAAHAAGVDFVAISEERGEVAFGNPEAPLRVVIDPIDGSLNARRTLPSFALSVAIATGPSMADVAAAFVHDFGADEEFTAVREAGAALDGEPLQARGPGYGLEVVGLEASKPELIAPIVSGLIGKAYRCRSVGALAISLCYVAAGRFDGMIAARPARSVDVAAAQLIAREAGASVQFGEGGLEGAHLDLEARFDLAAALDDEMLGTLREVQREAAKQRA
jgi:myo-inositol-1(or 4)-monophosphatase